jgi:hypothetical protein
MSESCCHTLDVRVVDPRFVLRAADPWLGWPRRRAAARCPRRRSVARCPRRRGRSGSAPPGTALRASCWSRLGDEGGKPGGLRASCARGWSQAASVSQHLGAQEANRLGFLPETRRNSRWLANCPCLASENAAKPGQFTRSPAKVLRKARALRRVARERAQQAPGSSPSLPIRDQRDARRAAPAGADAARPRLTPTRSRRTPPDPAAAASRPRSGRRGVDTGPRSTIGARRRRSLPCRRSALPRGRRRR